MCVSNSNASNSVTAFIGKLTIHKVSNNDSEFLGFAHTLTWIEKLGISSKCNDEPYAYCSFVVFVMVGGILVVIVTTFDSSSAILCSITIATRIYARRD